MGGGLKEMREGEKKGNAQYEAQRGKERGAAAVLPRGIGPMNGEGKATLTLL